MKNNNPGSINLLTAIRQMLVYANFSGFIQQQPNTALRQFDIGQVYGDPDAAIMKLRFDGSEYMLSLTMIKEGDAV